MRTCWWSRGPPVEDPLVLLSRRGPTRAPQPQRGVGLGEFADARDQRAALLQLRFHRGGVAESEVGGGAERLRRLVGLNGVERLRRGGRRVGAGRLLQRIAQVFDDELAVLADSRLRRPITGDGFPRDSLERERPIREAPARGVRACPAMTARWSGKCLL